MCLSMSLFCPPGGAAERLMLAELISTFDQRGQIIMHLQGKLHCAMPEQSNESLMKI